MGWCHSDGSHEGYLVGLVFDSGGVFLGPAGEGWAPSVAKRTPRDQTGRMRELGGNDSATLTLRFVKAACSCGWRSPLLEAPPGSEWVPCSVFAPEWFEDAARELWKRHASECGPVRDGGLVLSPPRGCVRCNGSGHRPVTTRGPDGNPVRCPHCNDATAERR